MRSGKISAQAIVEQSLDRIAKIDSSGYTLNSVIALSPDSEPKNIINPKLPLAGLPILIKDNVECIGLPGSAGSLALAKYPVKTDSTIVARLRNAGAEIVAATNLSEWANIRSTKSTSGWSGFGGLTANPWIHERSAGGSSSGSGAAIAAGLVSLAVGTETDGSIICPASLNGCVGIKPTVNSVPRDGVIPISASQDSPGSMARTVEDAALLLEVMMGRTDLIGAASANRALKIGVVKSWITGHAGTDALLEGAIDLLAKSGISILEVDLSPPDEETGNDEYAVLLHELFDDLGSHLMKRCNGELATLADVIRFNQEHSATELKFFGQELFEQAILLGGRTGEYAAKRERNLTWATTTLDEGLEKFDVLIGATYSPAWLSTLGKGDEYSNSSWITTAPAIVGSPIGCVPMGITEGLPVGLGVVSRKYDEITLITAMKEIETILSLGIMQPTFLK
ncbi:MAG: amidase [Actinobacteria bacterium]|nr:amidase [Actinomycetota bacterium]